MKTTEEVLEALRSCTNQTCNGCPYFGTTDMGELTVCMDYMKNDAIRTINRLLVENKSLHEALDMYGGGDGITAAYEERDRLADEKRVLRAKLTADSKHKTTSDMVNHPPHYESGKYECIDVMEEVYGTEIVKDFCLCNAFKYLYRCMHKYDSPIEDTRKSAWYLKKYFELGDRSNDD